MFKSNRPNYFLGIDIAKKTFHVAFLGHNKVKYKTFENGLKLYQRGY